MPTSPTRASPATRIMVSIQNAGPVRGIGTLARHTRPVTRALPPSLSRAPRDPLDHHRLCLTAGEHVT